MTLHGSPAGIIRSQIQPPGLRWIGTLVNWKLLTLSTESHNLSRTTCTTSQWKQWMAVSKPWRLFCLHHKCRDRLVIVSTRAPALTSQWLYSDRPVLIKELRKTVQHLGVVTISQSLLAVYWPHLKLCCDGSFSFRHVNNLSTYFLISIPQFLSIKENRLTPGCGYHLSVDLTLRTELDHFPFGIWIILPTYKPGVITQNHLD